MPQVNIQGVGKVNFPEGMTPEQIQHAIETDILPKASAQPAKDDIAPEKPPLAARIGRGAQDVVDRIAQLTVAAGEKLGAYPKGLGDVLTQNLNEENALYAKGRGEKAGIDFARIIGNAGMQAPLAALPGGGATVLGRAGAGAVSGAASGLLQYDPTNSIKGTAKNTATGAAVGAVVAPIAGAISDKAIQLGQKMAGWWKGIRADNAGVDDLLRAVPELNDLPASAQRDLIAEAQSQIKETGTLNAEQLARKANLVAQGVKPTKSMVTRSPTDWTLERNLQKLAQSPDEQLGQVGQELTNVYEGNNKALTAKLSGMTSDLPKGTQEAHGMNVMQSLDDLSTASQEKVGQIYNAVRESRGDQLASDARNLASTLDDLKDNTYAEKLVSSVTNKLKRFGMIDKDGALTSKTLTVNQSEELRKFVNTLPNDFGKRDIIKAIDSDVMTGLGDDAFGLARKAAENRFDTLGNPATQKALNTLGELNQGKTAQNFIKSQVIDAADQDVGTLVSTLSKLPPEKAAQSINSLRAGVLQHFQEKSINVNSGQFSGAALNKAVDDFGAEKLIRIFGPERAKEIRNLARAGIDATYQPPFSAVNNSNTAPMLMSLMQKSRAIPGVPLLVTDEAAKMAARSGYKSQLADALAAKTSRELPQLPASTQDFIRLFSQSGTPASVAALNQARQPTNKNSKDRK